MKQLEKKDLIIGEIYSAINQTNSLCIFKHKYADNDMSAIEHYAFVSEDRNYFKKDNIHYVFKNLKLAIPEEKHWLETCIKADNFVSYEEAMKTFIPEYVECVYSYNNRFIENKIYKVLEYSNINEPRVTIDNHSYYKHLPFNGDSWKFKPSTKEAYDAQFVVKEPEFVLLKIWWVRITKENLKDISKFLDFNLGKYTIGFVAGMVKSGISGIVTKGYNSTPTTSYGSTFGNEITYDQFKQYVLKENTTVIEKPKVVLEEPKDKVLTLSSNYGKESIVKVESSEGGIYQLGDKVVVFDKSNLNNNKPCEIIGFRWTNDKKEICAITTSHQGLGIRLSKIELYSEPVVKELSLLEQAKLKYPIGTKVKSLLGHLCIIAKQSHINYINSDGYCENTDSIWFTGSPYSPLIYRKGQWAEIVEDFKLPEKWCVRRTVNNSEIINNWCNNNHIDDEHNNYIDTCGYIHSERCNNSFNSFKRSKGGAQDLSFTEITFEQFEQYVLHNGFKVGDRFTKQKYCEVTEKEIIALEYIRNSSIAVYKYTSNNHTSPQCRILTKNIVR